MTEQIVIELPHDLAEQIRVVATKTQRSFDEVLVEWIRRAGAEPVLELLPDEELLPLCDLDLPVEQAEELSALLEDNREGSLRDEERHRLDELMRLYRTGLIRKAQALKVAVGRGLRPRLN